MKYSIITINYNNCDGLRRTIESVISQTYNDYEYIIIDGGSTDGSVDVIKEYLQCINYWVSEQDGGIYNAMNKGIALANGEYLNFMNSGDAFYDIDVLSHVAGSTKDYDIIVGKDYHENPITKEFATTQLPSRLTMAMFFVQTIPHQSAFIKRTLFNGHPYDESLNIVADWKFYVDKIVKDGKKLHLLDYIVCRREQGGISVTREEETINERTKVLKDFLPTGIYKDYESLSKLDPSTLFKFLNLCDDNKFRKYLIYSIKIINRIKNFTLIILPVLIFVYLQHIHTFYYYLSELDYHHIS